MLIMDNRLRSTITLHNSSHGFIQGRGTGTVTMEGKLAHQLVGLFHELLFKVLLDVKKPYN